MRLLSLNDRGDLAWNDFAQDVIQRYAILSHRWETEEVTFNDLRRDNGRSKAGRAKIIFCGERAKRDDLHYFWVDTCCIDKQDSNELTEAINSMFRYYRGAAKCYVYLSDVSTSSSDPKTCQSAWEAEFRASKWFTRGWTLQELLAPSSVIFHTSQWRELGDKTSLANVIHETTGIPLLALQGHPLDTFSVDERMSWAAKRLTTRDEDGAYCLLGIFGIFMPLIYGEGKEHAMKRLQREVDGLPVTANTCFMVPFDRNPRFTGRESILASLEHKLFVGKQTTKVAIAGLGGIGKTQVALELAYRTRAKYRNCSVFWIPATDMDSLHLAYRDVARQLAIPGCDEDKADVKKLVQAHLSRENSRPWLLVFDNADDIGMWVCSPGSASGTTSGSSGLKEVMPRSNQGCIVFTTRDKKTAVKLVGQNVVEVPEMDEAGALQLVQKSLIEPALLGDQHAAKVLLKELTFLPLAIIQAAAYMNENGITPSEYLSLFDKKEANLIKLLAKDFEDDWRYHSVKNPVATTWLISFQQIGSHSPLAAEYLSFASCIDRKDIPQSLLPAGPSEIEEIEAIGTLQAYSFVVKRSGAMMLDLHRLVQLATRSWLENERTLSQWTLMAIQRLESLFPDDEQQNRAQWRMLLPHAAYSLRLGSIAQDDNSRMSLQWKYAKSLHSDGRYKEAEAWFDDLLGIQKRTLGEEHPSTLASLASLAWTYWDQGRWKEAEELGVRVVETSLSVLGEEHPDTLSSIAILALIYQYQGRWKEAEDLHVRVVETRKRIFGEEHPFTLISMHNLALNHRDQGRWNQAEKLLAQIVEINESKLGVDHPHTLVNRNQLALTYSIQGQANKSEILMKRVVETSSRVLGEEHPDTLTSIANLASTYRDQGRWKEAEELEMRVMETRKRVLGEEHPDTLTSMSSLASMFCDQGRWKEAEELEVRVMKTRKRVLGEEHPDMLASMANLALVYSGQGQWKEAEELEVPVMETRKRVLGKEHPHTLTSIANLASTYRKQGRWKEAEELQAEELKACSSILGDRHPDTLISMDNLASIWKDQGRDGDAAELLAECVRLRMQVLGFDHPYTISSSQKLDCWKQQGLYFDRRT